MSNSAPDIVILIVINSHVSIALASKSHSCSWANLLPNTEQLLQSRGSHALRFHGNLISLSVQSVRFHSRHVSLQKSVTSLDSLAPVVMVT